MARTVDTKVKCPHCKTGNIFAEVESKFDTTFGPAVFGPGSESQHRQVVSSFYCSNQDCALLFRNPPGKPNFVGEILSHIAEAGETRRFGMSEQAINDMRVRFEDRIVPGRGSVRSAPDLSLLCPDSEQSEPDEDDCC